VEIFINFKLSVSVSKRHFFLFAGGRDRDLSVVRVRFDGCGEAEFDK
jgi:hypothetical protein